MGFESVELLGATFYVMKLFICISILLFILLVKVILGEGLAPSMHWAGGQVHPGQVASLSKG